MADSYRTVSDTPEKHKNPEDGYQVLGVGEVGRVPAMNAERIKRPSRNGAAPTAHGGAPMSADGAFLDD